MIIVPAIVGRKIGLLNLQVSMQILIAICSIVNVVTLVIGERKILTVRPILVQGMLLIKLSSLQLHEAIIVLVVKKVGASKLVVGSLTVVVKKAEAEYWVADSLIIVDNQIVVAIKDNAIAVLGNIKIRTAAHLRKTFFKIIPNPKIKNGHLYTTL